MDDGAAPPVYAVFVSPHGFGHAARASAVMAALRELEGARFELFATTPRWFFDETVEGAYAWHEVAADVGLRQRSALDYDLDATVAALDDLLPFDEGRVEALAAAVMRSGARAVLCDIAPLGIAVARRAGLPSLLLENFTWPWLYEPLVDRAPRLALHSRELKTWFGRATAHVQTEPLCHRDPDADLVVPPIARRPRRSRTQVRAELGLEPAVPVVVLTMGGVSQELPFLDRLRRQEDVRYLVTGVERTRRDGNLYLFDNRTRIYLPDFIRAADAVVAKLGYSTLAEVWHEGVPLAFVSRRDFRETGPLRRWAADRLRGFEIPGEDFAGGRWVDRIPALLALGRTAPGADAASGRAGGGRGSVGGSSGSVGGPAAGEGARERRSERPAVRVARLLRRLGSGPEERG